MKRLLVVGLLAAVLLLAGCAHKVLTTAAVSELGNESASPPAFSPDEIVLGEVVYTNHCANCHGDRLEGEVDWKLQNEDGSFRSPPHSADGHTWHHADTILIQAIKEGGARYNELDSGITSNMPAFAATLSDEEITAVLNYIKSTWPEDIRALQWQQTMQDTSQ